MHTPTWTAVKGLGYGQLNGAQIVDDRTGYVVAVAIGDVPDLKPEETAAFIVRACNAHDDLVKALDECLREHGGFHIAGECERRARAALAKATQP